MINRIKSLLPSDFRKKIGILKRRIQSIFLKGDNFKCPICERKFRKFIPAGVVKRANAVCPNCDSFERHRLLWLYLISKGLLDNKIKLLHFAPEDSLKSKLSNLDNVNYITLDLYENSVSLKGDIQKLPFVANTFDSVICSHVLEHLPDDRKGLAEIFRILKKDGWAIFQIPFDEGREMTYENPLIISSEERLKHFGQEDHMRIYGKDFCHRLEAAGFNITMDNFVNTLSDEEVNKYSLMKDEVIFFVTK